MAAEPIYTGVALRVRLRASFPAGLRRAFRQAHPLGQGSARNVFGSGIDAARPWLRTSAPRSCCRPPAPRIAGSVAGSDRLWGSKTGGAALGKPGPKPSSLFTPRPGLLSRRAMVPPHEVERAATGPLRPEASRGFHGQRGFLRSCPSSSQKRTHIAHRTHRTSHTSHIASHIASHRIAHRIAHRIDSIGHRGASASGIGAWTHSKVHSFGLTRGHAASY
jgi:hypothetical protein